MSARLPPLNALRAFEVAARHLSFKRAAEELHVTPAAVGHQVKGLEDHLGVQLFRRLNRGLLLTDAGQTCLPYLREGFEKLAQAVEVVRKGASRGVLTVTVEPDFAAKWLVRRLEGFRARHPDVEMRLDATSQVLDFGRERVDVGIRYGRGEYPGYRVDKLFDDVVMAVCSPRLLEGEHPLQAPADLRWHTLIHEDWSTMDETWPTWRMWLMAAGCQDIDWNRGLRFRQYHMVLQAAAEGLGVALGSRVLVADDLAAGRLVAPFERVLATPVRFGYYVVSLEADADKPEIKAFREWVLDEASATQADLNL